MKQTEKEKRQQQYEDYVKKKTPVHNVYLNMAKSFITGGIICVIGQGIYNYCEMIGLSKDHCSNWTSLSLILLSIILAGAATELAKPVMGTSAPAPPHFAIFG